jgi:GWxTD domain-containing protein
VQTTACQRFGTDDGQLFRFAAMRIILILLALLMPLSHSLLAGVQARFNYGVFYAPGEGPYVETYLSVGGNSPVYQLNEAGKLQARLLVTYSFMQGDKIVKALKYHLNSPEISDSLSQRPNFMDQQRVALPNGDYLLKIEIKDTQGTDKTFKGEQPIQISFAENQINLSDIQFLDDFSPTQETGMLVKHGYRLVPNTSAYYAPNQEKLRYYAEVYHTDKVFSGEKYLLRYAISGYENNKILPAYTAFVRMDSRNVNILLREINISKLPSGNYHLFIEIRDRENNLIFSKTGFFQRSNPAIDQILDDYTTLSISDAFVERYRSKDTISEYINSLRPIASAAEVAQIDQMVQNKHEYSQETMQKYFLGFWQKRNPTDPETEWKQYAAEVEKVNARFSTAIKRGYETDRGRVYLQYGPPNSRVSVPSEPSTYPYEVWQYYRVRNQNDGRFIFYNRDLVSNEYELLHSTVRGELQNFRWQYVIQERNVTNRDIDDEYPGSTVGNRSDDFFEMPR